ncbi:hypothetical protein ACLMJK_005941 [Lecanora helva]
MKEISVFARDTCNGFQGNTDLYGLGIRIGIYLQWISSLLTNIFLPNAISESLDTNAIFLFALFIAIANATTNQEKLHPAEAFVALQLCFGFLLSVLSVGGARLTLLNEPRPEILFSRLRHRPAFVKNLLQNIQQQAAKTSPQEPEHFMQRLRNRLAQSMLRQSPEPLFEKTPSNLPLSRSDKFWLIIIDMAKVHSLYPASYSLYDYGSLLTSGLEPLMLMIDLFVFFKLRELRMFDNPDDPAKSYLQKRLLHHQKIRQLARGSMNPQIYSLGVSSGFKNDQISWLGIAWRTCAVAGIGTYNVWFWFSGIEFLRSGTCPTYIFIFCKADILGRARVFFKMVSIIYLVYGSLLTLACLSGIIAFIQTSFRSLVINLFVIPYAKVLLTLSAANSARAKQRLEMFDVTRNDFLDWLGVPNFRLLLCGFAYLSSTMHQSTETAAPSDQRDNGGNLVTKSAWAPRLKAFCLLITLFIVIWTILTVELTLAYNSISGVYKIDSTGQLIPFTIGVIGLGKTINSMIINIIKKTYPNWQHIDLWVDEHGRVGIRDIPDNEPNPPQSKDTQNVMMHDMVPEGIKAQNLPHTSTPPPSTPA